MADEFFSISFANNTKDYLFLSRGAIEQYGSDGWISGNFIRETFSVQKGEEFAIMTIHRNVRGDVHPPLYFMVLNILSSFFKDRIVCIPGHTINIIMGLLICILTYLITLKITDEKYLSLIAPLMWINSEAAHTTISYIRMYATLCVLILFVIYFHIRLMDERSLSEGKCELTNLLFIGGLTFCGTLTHYYFYILMFFVAIVSCIHMLLIKKYKLLMKYLGINIIFEICSLCCWPYVVKHLLGSERGLQVQDNLATTSVATFKEKVVSFLTTINIYVFNSYMVCVLLFLAIVFLLAAYICKRRNIKTDIVKGYPIIMIVTVEMGYLLTLVIISYSSRWLYMSPVFSLLHISIAILIIWILRILKSNVVNPVCVVILGILLFVRVISVVSTNVQIHDFNTARNEHISSYTKNKDVLFLYEEWNSLFDNQIIEISEADEVGIADINDLYTTDLKEKSNSRKSNDGIVVYLPKNIENDTEIINYICQNMDYTDSTLIDDYSNKIYYLEN